MYDLGLIDYSLESLVGGDDIAALSKKMYPKIPLLAISGFDEKIQGIDGLLTKPFTPENMLRIIESYLK
jgi:CheY-like chemotaxis protein